MSGSLNGNEPVFALNGVQRKPASVSFLGRGAGKPIFAKNGFPSHIHKYMPAAGLFLFVFVFLVFLIVQGVRDRRGGRDGFFKF